MKYFISADPDLTDLANQLEYIPFEMTQEEYETFEELSKADTLQGVSAYLGGRTFRVRMCIGGKQHVIGICRKGPHAARYADMARLFFWPYRLRDRRLPEDRDFNYGLEATKHALADNTNAVRVLEKILSHLIKIAELSVASRQTETEGLNKKTLRDTRRTLRGEFLHMHEEGMKRAVALEQRLETLQKALEANIAASKHDYDEIKLAFRHLNDAMQRIEQRLTKDEQLPPRVYWSAGSAEQIAKLSPEAAVNRDATFGSHLNDVGTEHTYGAGGPDDDARQWPNTDGLFDTNTKL